MNEALLSPKPMQVLPSINHANDKLEEKLPPSQIDEEEEEVSDYMRIKELFSFENIARMHREIEQLKDVVREMRGHTIPKLERENAMLKEQNKEVIKELT